MSRWILQAIVAVATIFQSGVVKGPWTKEEDQKIIDCITQNITKWSEIAERVEGRVGKQCRERWFNHLDPTLKKSCWTPAEDEVLVAGQARYGNRCVGYRSRFPLASLGRARLSLKFQPLILRYTCDGCHLLPFDLGHLAHKIFALTAGPRLRSFCLGALRML